MDDTYVDVPTIFEIQIRESGWIHTVFVKIDDIYIPCEWVGYTRRFRNSRYSLFRAEYTFKNVMRDKKAVFHYYIGNSQHVCKPIIFNVYP